MSKVIDVREAVGVVTVIQFSDPNDLHTSATRLTLKSGGVLAIEEDDGLGGAEDVRVVSVTHTRNLIKALEKAIELGWLSEEEQ